jgi:AraC-like DNA-binding protein/quercetin dioxygenase-like cupin family protein
MKATYVKTKLTDVINITKIVTVHDFEFNKDFDFQGESHDFWEMVYIDKGAVSIRRDDDELELSRGEIIFHAPNEFHSIRAYDSAPNFFVISFVCHSPFMTYLEKYHTVLNKQLLGFISSIMKEAENTYSIPKNDPTLKKLTKKENASFGGEQLIKTYLEQFLILLIRDITKEDSGSVFPTKESMETHLVTRVKELLAAGTKERFSMKKLCASLGYSKSYLCRLFHEQTGETIARCATKEKIKLAKQLIREENLNFSEISDILAFDNPQYFSRTFKRITGLTPTEFKSSFKFKG